jgi:(p)ppGpp synthase/HD superfamily hydrolase
MENFEKDILAGMVIAPYLQKATALRGVKRYVGGNQFRHAFATLAILIDYHYMDAVLLKASVIHDLIEDVKSTSHHEIRSIDSDGPKVLELVLEVTKQEKETKEDFLKRILLHGSDSAKVLKCADRISNLTDLHPDIFDKTYIKNMMADTKNWVVPMAQQVNKDMLFELLDLIKRRETNLTYSSAIWPMKRNDKG